MDKYSLFSLKLQVLPLMGPHDSTQTQLSHKKKKKKGGRKTRKMLLLLLLLLNHFSHVQLYVTPKTAAHQAPPSLGFSRQEHWSGLPFPYPMHESEK